MSLLASFFGRNTNFLEYFLGFASENSAKFVLRPQNEASNGPFLKKINTICIAACHKLGPQQLGQPKQLMEQKNWGKNREIIYVSFLGSRFGANWNFDLKIVRSTNFFDTRIDASRFTLNY